MSGLLEWFWELDCGRNVVPGMGVSPLSWRDFQSWKELTGNEPEPWEIRALFRMDKAALELGSGGSDEPPPLTAGALTAMLEGSRKR